MKKSKILAVALSALTFSTAAAVTGTVAWYFAQRTVSVSMNNITSFNPETGLKVKLSEGVGTSIEESESQSASKPARVAQKGMIRDGSVDLENRVAYRSILNRAGDEIEGFKDLHFTNDEEMSGKAIVPGTSGETKFYYATNYKASFELTRKEVGKKFAVYYDNSKLEVGGASFVQESLRIGFRFDAGTPEDTSDDNYFVVAPFRNANGDKYVNGTDKDDFAHYDMVPNPAYDPAEAAANPDDYHVPEKLGEKKIIYGYETEYKKLEKTDYYGNPVEIPDFEYNPNLKLTKDVVTGVTEGENPQEIIETFPAYTPTTKGDAEDNLDGVDGSVTEANKAKALGYLGTLDANAAINPDQPDEPVNYLSIKVEVFTWFEGTDLSSIAEWVDNQGLNVNLSFNMAEIVG